MIPRYWHSHPGTAHAAALDSVYSLCGKYVDKVGAAEVFVGKKAGA